MSKDIVRVKLDKVKKEVDLTQVNMSENALSPRGYFTSPFSLENRKLVRKAYLGELDNPTARFSLYGFGVASFSTLATLITAGTDSALGLAISGGALLASSNVSIVSWIKMSKRNKKVFELMDKLEKAQMPLVRDWLKTRYNLDVDDSYLIGLNQSIFGSAFSFSNIPLHNKKLISGFYRVYNNLEFRDKKGDFFLLKSVGSFDEREFYIEEVARKEVTAVDKITDSKNIHAFSGEASTLYESIIARVASLHDAPLDSEQQYYLSSMSAALENVITIDTQYKKVNMSDESPARVIEILSTLNEKVSRIQTAALAELEKQLFIQFSSLNEQQVQNESVKAIDALESQKVEKQNV